LICQYRTGFFLPSPLRLLTDPTFDAPGVYQLPHVKLEELVGPAVTAETIGEVDAVLLSHDQHSDNLDHSGRDFLKTAKRVLPFAGTAQTRGPFHLTMDTNDTIETARAFADAAIVPVHTDGWAHFRQNADDLRASFDTLGFGPRLRILEPGVATVIEPFHPA
jgi:L-ascorbate metabolism protein UlaG (beta-lactamase superfamily)